MSFSITNNKGVGIKFANGCSISIQWGPGNYCERKHDDYAAPKSAECWRSIDAEIAVLDVDGEFFRISNWDDVLGWVDADLVAKVIGWVSTLPECSTRKNTIVPEWIGGFTGGVEDIDPEPKEESDDGT